MWYNEIYFVIYEYLVKRTIFEISEGSSINEFTQTYIS